MNTQPAADLVNDGDQRRAKISQLHVHYSAKDVLTTTDLVQQDHDIRTLVDTLLKTSANSTFLLSCADFATFTGTKPRVCNPA